MINYNVSKIISKLGERGGVCQGGVWSGGCLPGMGVSAREGAVCLRAVHLPCGQIDTCENITFPQLLLRTVITRLSPCTETKQGACIPRAP